MIRVKKDKFKKYGNFVASPLAELLVLECETDERWNETAVDLVRKLVKHKVQKEHSLLRGRPNWRGQTDGGPC